MAQTQRPSSSTNWTLAEAVPDFDARLRIVVESTHASDTRMLKWIAGSSALWGIWHLQDDNNESGLRSHTRSAAVA